MSVHIQAAVWINERVGGSAKLVLLKFADQCRDDGTGAWPSVPRVARECGMSERQVSRIIGKLVALGHLVETSPANTEHRSATYTVVADPRHLVTPDIEVSQMSPDPSGDPDPPLRLLHVVQGSGIGSGDIPAKQKSRVTRPPLAPVRALLITAHAELTGLNHPSLVDEQQLNDWEDAGVTMAMVNEARAEMESWDRAPAHPWGAFRSALGRALVKSKESTHERDSSRSASARTGTDGGAPRAGGVGTHGARGDGLRGREGGPADGWPKGKPRPLPDDWHIPTADEIAAAGVLPPEPGGTG